MRSAILAVTALLLLGCNRDPWYAPPPQRSPIVADEHPRGQFTGMGDPAADTYIVKDISETVEGGSWRWTYQRPELQFWLAETFGAKLSVDFLCSGLTLKDTGPLKITFFVNDRLFGTATCADAGNYRFEKAVPPEWLTTAAPTTVAMQPDKLWTAPGDGRKLGIILIGAGFITEPRP